MTRKYYQKPYYSFAHIYLKRAKGKYNFGFLRVYNTNPGPCFAATPYLITFLQPTRHGYRMPLFLDNFLIQHLMDSLLIDVVKTCDFIKLGSFNA